MTVQVISELNGPTARVEMKDELVTLLTDIGVAKPAALILVALHRAEELTSKEMQKACKLRQPEISMAMKSLISEGKVVCTSDQNGGRGRPSHRYHLGGQFSEVIEPFITDAQSRLDALEASLNEISTVSANLRNGSSDHS